MDKVTDAATLTFLRRAMLRVAGHTERVCAKSAKLWFILFLVVMLASMTTLVIPAYAANFDVNEVGDAHDADLDDHVCDSDLGAAGLQCTLRAAVEQANSLAGGDTINLTRSGSYNLSIGQLIITSQITLNGNGHTIQRAGDQQFRILFVSAIGDLTLNNVTIQEGDVVGQGGGVYISAGGVVNIFHSSMTRNSATAPGAAILNRGTLNMFESAVFSNTTTSYGGGITNIGGTLNIANSTISSNIANHDGGGIDNTGSGDGGTANLTHVTITRNTANNNCVMPGTGGGIYNYNGTVNLKNSIVAENVDTPCDGAPNWNKPDVGGSITSHGYNLIGDLGSTSVPPQPGDMFGTTDSPIDPLLGDLTGNPPYHPLLPGSPGIDQVPEIFCTFISSGSNPLFNDGEPVRTDQRGITRPSGGGAGDTPACDIGAYEVGGAVYLPIIFAN